MYHILSVQDNSAEITTVSLSLLTDRTLALREQEGISNTLSSGKCHSLLEKYNATQTEVYCVCWANCPWRPPTEFEKEMKKEFIRVMNQTTFYRKLILGLAFSVIFILGVTGKICF